MSSYKLKIEFDVVKYNQIDASVAGDKIDPFSREFKRLPGKYPLKIEWDPEKFVISRNDVILLTLTTIGSIKHVGVLPKPTSGITFKDTYNYLANTEQVCEDMNKYPLLVCNLYILPEKSVPKTANMSFEEVLHGNFYKASSPSDKYEIRIVLNNTDRDPYNLDISNVAKNPLFYIVKNNHNQVKAHAHFFTGKNITLGVNFGKSYTFVDNDDISSALQWEEQEPHFSLEALSRIILQNLKTTKVSYNSCEVQCINRSKRGFFGRIKTLVKSYFSLEEYCRQTELDRS